MALFPLIFLIYFSFHFFKIKLFYPLGLLILFFFIIPFVGYPILKIISFLGTNDLQPFIDEINIGLIYVNVAFVFWLLGFQILGKFKNKNIVINYDYSDRFFGYALIFFGICLYFFVFSYVGISFTNSFYDPLGTRFSIINKPGGFYLRTISFWTMWCGWFLIFLLYLKGYKISKIKLLFYFSFIIFLTLPLGQRSLTIFPFIFIFLILFYLKKISFKKTFSIFLLLFFSIPILGLYRELGQSDFGFTFSSFIENFGIMFTNIQGVLFLISERINNLYFFTVFLEFKDQIDYDLIDSISGFFNLFVPSFFSFGEKSYDLTTLLTLKHLGSLKYGTYDFTAFPEWFLIGGYLGIPFFAFFSGLINRFLVEGVFKIGGSLFFLMLFTDGFFLKYPFITLNNINNILLIIFIIYSLIIYLLFNTYRRLRKMKNSIN